MDVFMYGGIRGSNEIYGTAAMQLESYCSEYVD